MHVNNGELKHVFVIGEPATARRTSVVTSRPMADCSLPKETLITCSMLNVPSSVSTGIEFGTLGTTGIPRLLDMGQCNDSYGAVVVAQALAQALNTDVNSIDLFRWPFLGSSRRPSPFFSLCGPSRRIRNIRLGPVLPCIPHDRLLSSTNCLVQKMTILTPIDCTTPHRRSEVNDASVGALTPAPAQRMGIPFLWDVILFNGTSFSILMGRRSILLADVILFLWDVVLFWLGRRSILMGRILFWWERCSIVMERRSIFDWTSFYFDWNVILWMMKRQRFLIERCYSFWLERRSILMKRRSVLTGTSFYFDGTSFYFDGTSFYFDGTSFLILMERCSISILRTSTIYFDGTSFNFDRTSCLVKCSSFRIKPI